MKFDGNNFLEFNLKSKVLQGIADAGFNTPSPVQKAAIPLILEGHDLIAQAQTGTGKTAAFAIPILNMLQNNLDIEALIITPTRELAMQISDEVFRLGKFLKTKTICMYGGQSIKRQIDLLDKKPKVMVATPGRLLDHLKNDRIRNFNPKIVVLDESDEMLDMGFLDSIEEIFRFIPRDRQTLLFSATMPTPIKNLANKILNNPKNVKITNINLTNTDIEQKYYIINENERDDAITRLLDVTSPKKSIIFTRMKKEADILADFLISKGYKATALHGDMEQRDRQIAVKAFKDNNVEILVATDVASRGLDISNVSHVFNYHIPINPDSYVHRIGRTGRAGKKGIAITLVTPLEFKDLRRIKEQIKTELDLFEISSKQDHSDFVSKVLDYKISPKALDLYPLFDAKIDNAQLTCKLLSYLFDVLSPDYGDIFNETDLKTDSKKVSSFKHKKSNIKKNNTNRRNSTNNKKRRKRF